jgi:plastocyanin
MRRTLTALSAVAVAAGFATSASAGTAKSVTVGDNYFMKPAGVPTLSVKRGTTVSWRFKGKESHIVAVKSGPAKFASTAKRSGTFSKRLTKAGTYSIYCSIHGAGDQSMKLVVR